MNTLRFFTEPLRVIEEAPICKDGDYRDSTQCDDAKYIICSKFFKE